MILERPYSKDLFEAFLKDFLPDYVNDRRPVRAHDNSILTQVTQLGKSQDTNLTVLEAECEETDSNKRIAITQAAFRILRDHGIRNAIIAFHDGANQWRLSLLTSTLELKDGKVVKKDSNPRRYSYLLGIGAKTKTPHKYLIEKGSVTDIKSLQERFSVEVVNKQFYESIAELFTKLVGGDRGKVKHPGVLKINGHTSQNNEHQEFAVRLIGRIIFSWFLKEKKSTVGVPIVPDELLSLNALEMHGDYYHSILEPLFFELLNKRLNNRHESLRQGAFATVPYLNGGLFSPQHTDYYEQNSFTGGGNPGVVSIPDNWFKELFTILEQYNFTVDENTSYDVDLSIDPEMLGRIFENLLAEINPETGESARKSTGSFYTPREIVDYMVDSSLLEYLKSKTLIDEPKLKAIISWGQQDDRQHPLTEMEKKNVVDSLATLTILDPACGSGAFPIGLLQKVVYILQQVDEKAEIWLENQLKNIISPELRRDIEEKYRSENYDWLRKLGVIRESIFGVDIQTIATEIAKLRCFLTLVIEEEVDDTKENRGIRPLPNLDFKFVTANSLIGLPESNNNAPTLFEDKSHIERLKEIRNKYFGADADERSRLQVEFKDLQLSMFRSRIAANGGTSDLYNALSDWNPFSHEKTDWFDPQWMFGVEGFDIVIANPPYIRQEEINYKGMLETTYGPKSNNDIYNGRADLFIYFYVRSFSLLKESGILTFITSDKFLTRGYAKKLRKYLRDRVKMLAIYDFGERKVFEATVEACIFIGINTKPADSELVFYEISSTNDVENLSYYPKEKGITICQNSLGDEEWIITKPEDAELLNKLNLNSVTLGSYVDNQIFSGIKTGKNSVFIIDDIKRDELIKEDGRSVELIKKWLVGNDIEPYSVKWSKKYLIFINNDTKIDEYPAIHKYLLANRPALESRAAIKPDRWYQLQQPQTGLYKYFEGPKIIYQNVSRYYKFSLDKSGYYLDMNLFFIPSSDLYLLGVLSSSTLQYFAHRLTDTSPGGFLVLKTMYTNKFPVPTASTEEKGRIETIVSKLIASSEDYTYKNALKRELDSAVYQLFSLLPDEIKIIENFVYADQEVV